MFLITKHLRGSPLTPPVNLLTERPQLHSTPRVALFSTKSNITTVNKFGSSKAILIPSNLEVLFADNYGPEVACFIEKKIDLANKTLTLSSAMKFWRYTVLTAFEYIGLTEEIASEYREPPSPVSIFFFDKPLTVDGLATFKDEIQEMEILGVKCEITLHFETKEFEYLSSLEIWFELT